MSIFQVFSFTLMLLYNLRIALHNFLGGGAYLEKIIKSNSWFTVSNDLIRSVNMTNEDKLWLYCVYSIFLNMKDPS